MKTTYVHTGPDGTKWQKLDTSTWPVVPNKKYAEILTQIAAGLLASGHYTSEVGDSDDPGFNSVLTERNFRGHYVTSVIEAADRIARDILEKSNLNHPHTTDGWEDVS